MRSAWPHTVVLFAIMLAHALLETARDAVFLGELGPDALASAYIAIAVIAVATMAAARHLGVARHPRRMLVAFLGLAATGTVGLASVLATTASAAFALYLWSGVVATLVVPSFWVVVERGLRIADAKRGFGRIAAGGVLGAFTGSAIAGLLSRGVAPHHLATVAGIAFAIATAAALILAPADRSDEAPRSEPHVREPESTRAPRYVQLLLLLGVIATFALTLGDLMFKRVLAERIPAAELATWLGAIYAGLNVVALVVQLVITSRLLQHAGVGAALMFLPMFVLASALGFVATGALAAVIALKIADGGLRHSLHRVANEILFLPVSSSIGGGAKPMIDAVAQRGGQALAAITTIVLAPDAHTLALTLVVAVMLWLMSIGFTRAAYVGHFRATLEAGEIQRDVRVPVLDAHSVEMLTSALSSPDEAEAAAALDLLAMREEGIPALVLYHPSPAVVRRALGSLRGELRPDVVRVLQHLFAHPDPQVRAAAIAVSSRNGHGCPAKGLADPEPDVRAASAVALYDAPTAGAREVVEALVEGTTAERLALARAIAHQPGEPYRDVLLRLVVRREPAVVREVLQIWSHVPALADEELLLSLLAYSQIRGDARRALIALGALDRLVAALDDPRTPLGVRRHLPRTISRFHTPAAAAALVARLGREPDGTTEFKILRALGRMRANDRRLSIDATPLRQYVARSLEDAGRYRRLRAALLESESSPTLELLDELLLEKRRHAIERAFRALGILYPGAGLHSVHDAMTSDDEERAAAAREILDEAVPLDQRAVLIDELEQHGRGSGHTYTSADAALRALLVDRSDTLRCIAAHHVAQCRLVTLREELVRLKPTTGSELVTLAFDQAIESLHA